MEKRKGRRTALGYTACALAGALWGTGFFWGRLALNEMSVEHMLLYRFLFAMLVMLPVAARAWPRCRFTPAEWKILLISVTVGFPLQFLVQFHGLARTTVSHAALMVGAMPVLLAAAAALFAGERLDWFGWLALASSTVGAALIALGTLGGSGARGEPTLTGDLMVVVSLLGSIAWILMNKRLLARHRPTTVTSISIVIGSLMLAAWVLTPWALSPLTHAQVAPPPFQSVSWVAWMALAISGVLCTATTTLLWNWGMGQVPASRGGVFLNLEPALGSWLGMQFLGERLGGWAWAGGALILAAAVALTTRGGKSEATVILE